MSGMRRDGRLTADVIGFMLAMAALAGILADWPSRVRAMPRVKAQIE